MGDYKTAKEFLNFDFSRVPMPELRNHVTRLLSSLTSFYGIFFDKMA